MSRPATDRLKVNPPVGMRPSLENHRLQDLNVDAGYQRSIENVQSVTLIRRIATFWDWSLFHPLAVSRRADGTLWVVDGQHRLAAAKQRSDLLDLPCVVSAYASAGDEAASFVAMNVQRRPLSALDLFKAALVAGDQDAAVVMALIENAGLSLASHSNHTAWRPGMVSNISGIRSAYRTMGRAPVSAALVALSTVFVGQVLQYAGSIFAPLARCYARLLPDPAFDPDLLLDVLAGASQKDWFAEFSAERGRSSSSIAGAGEMVLLAAYREAAAVALEEAA